MIWFISLLAAAPGFGASMLCYHYIFRQKRFRLGSAGGEPEKAEKSSPRPAEKTPEEREASPKDGEESAVREAEKSSPQPAEKAPEEREASAQNGEESAVREAEKSSPQPAEKAPEEREASAQNGEKAAAPESRASFVEAVRAAILDKRHSALIVSLVFAALGAAAGGAAFFRLSADRSGADLAIALARPALCYVFLVIFALTDLKSFTVPNRLLGIFAAARLALIPLEYFFQAEAFWAVMRDCFIGAAACFIILLFISFVSRGGIGMGDVKLMALTALTAGAYGAFNTLLFGLLACALFAVAALLFGKKNMKDKVPFVPFLYIGFVISIVLGSF